MNDRWCHALHWINREKKKVIMVQLKAALCIHHGGPLKWVQKIVGKICHKLIVILAGKFFLGPSNGYWWWSCLTSSSHSKVDANWYGRHPGAKPHQQACLRSHQLQGYPWCIWRGHWWHVDPLQEGSGTNPLAFFMAWAGKMVADCWYQPWQQPCKFRPW